MHSCSQPRTILGLPLSILPGAFPLSQIGSPVTQVFKPIMSQDTIHGIHLIAHNIVLLVKPALYAEQ